MVFFGSPPYLLRIVVRRADGTVVVRFTKHDDHAGIA